MDYYLVILPLSCNWETCGKQNHGFSRVTGSVHPGKTGFCCTMGTGRQIGRNLDDYLGHQLVLVWLEETAKIRPVKSDIYSTAK